MNVKNALVLLAHLEKQRRTKQSARFNMMYWGSQIGDVAPESVLEQPICKTQACLAGETVLALKLAVINPQGGLQLNKAGLAHDIWIPGAAGDILELTGPERKRLFYFYSMGHGEGWPEKYEAAYKAAKSPRQRLTVAIRRLKHFIKTEGEE